MNLLNSANTSQLDWGRLPQNRVPKLGELVFKRRTKRGVFDFGMHVGIVSKVCVLDKGGVAGEVSLISSLAFGECSLDSWESRLVVPLTGDFFSLCSYGPESGGSFDGDEIFRPFYSDGERCRRYDRVYVEGDEEVAIGVVTYITELGICIIKHAEDEPILWAVPPFALRKVPEIFGLTLFDEEICL